MENRDVKGKTGIKWRNDNTSNKANKTMNNNNDRGNKYIVLLQVNVDKRSISINWFYLNDV